jgi:gamma-glutamyltranspeptidase/glutathione hydrolase
MPPPSSGGLTVIQMLLMLEQFDLGDQGAGFGFGATNTLHVLLEAMRLAYADRAVWDGDETCALCSDVPTVGLLNPLYVGPRAGQIQVDSRLENALPGDPRPFDVASVPGKVRFAAFAPEMQKGVNTTHFTVIDGHGNIVSYTSTIESGWGTGIMVPGFGFLLNNELTDFNFRPRANDDPNAFDPGANDVAANKRPRSSMAPTMVFKDGKPVAAYGSPGGSSIINTALNITLNLIDHGMSVQEAIDAPRISRTSSSDSGTVSCEGGFSAEALAGVTALGHVLRGSCLDGSGVIGSVQAVIVDLQTGKQYGGADARRIGTVIGLPRPAAD